MGGGRRLLVIILVEAEGDDTKVEDVDEAGRFR
jgi:hypothetical protein